MIDLDTVDLENCRDDVPPRELLSKDYLPSLSWILQINNIPFYKIMDRLYPSEVPTLVSRLSHTIAEHPINGVQRLSRFTSAFLGNLAQWPLKLSPCFIFLLNVFQNIVDSVVSRRRIEEAELGSTADLEPPESVDTAYTSFRSFDFAYQTFISKKSSWITNDTSDSILRSISNSYHNICILSPQFAVQVAHDLGIQVPRDAKEDEYPQIVLYGYRFQVLEKHITDGRMELRVYGMETMQNDLVNVWKQYIQGNPAGVNHPVIQYLVKTLREKKILEYILGVDSHPQLISRSGNIVGFLIVTSTYTNHDTDVIWNTVTESQDTRTVAEVLTMLMRTFNLHTLSSNGLQYLCTKLLQLPLNRFDSRMLEFCEQLFVVLRSNAEILKHERREFVHVDTVAHQLCVRLIRESNSIDEFSVDQKTNLREFAGNQLSLLLSLGSSDEDKAGMFKQCIDDISEKNEFAVGSIHALNAFVTPYDNQDIRRLALDFDLTRLAVAELVHALNTASTTDFSDPVVSNAMLPRIRLLHRIVEKVPETIDAGLSQLLWDNLFMSKKIGEQGQNIAWDVLSRTTSRAPKRNPFLERCMNDYLPLVSPEEYGINVLNFAKQAVSYEIRFNPPPVSKEDEVVVIPGMDRIWNIILTASAATVEIKATDFAIETYLDHPLIRKAPRSAVEATHVLLVDRCVEQLTSAASRLKTFSDGTTSGEDEPMIIVPSDGEVRSEELRFSRSLLFLRQLLHGLRTRPQYTPAQSSPPNIPLRPEDLKGDPIELSYQAFSGTSQTRVRTLRIGDLSTASELAEKLVKLTGFSKFSTFSAGQRLDLFGDPLRTLRELKLARSGLLIIRKHPDAFEVSVSGRRQSLTLVDSEVLKHFDDLYDLLGLEEKLSKEVYI